MTTQVPVSTILHRVTAFELLQDYVVRVQFADGSERVIDLEPMLYGPIFGGLRDAEIFTAVSLNEEFGALEWPNGADVAPNVLHDWDTHLNAIIARREQFK